MNAVGRTPVEPRKYDFITQRAIEHAASAEFSANPSAHSASGASSRRRRSSCRPLRGRMAPPLLSGAVAGARTGSTHSEEMEHP